MILDHLTVGDISDYFGHDDPETFDPRLLGLDEGEQDITQMDLPGESTEHSSTLFLAGRKQFVGAKWPSR